MQNSIKKSFAVQLAEANNTVEAKGLVLSRWDKSITKGDVNRFKKLCEFGGFWYSLGQILVQLRTESGGSRTDSALLKNASLHTVAKQRRSEAMKFFENFHVIVENDLLGKKSSICHMKDLLKEVDKIVNPKVEDEPVLEATIVADEPEAPAIEDKSSEAETKPMSPSDIALEALVQCELNNVQVKDFMLALKEQLEMLDENKAVA
jgi:hypothetical protein